MPSSFEHDLRGRLAAYVSGRASLRDFQEWFVPRAWIIDAAADPDQAQLAGYIELLLAEWSNGHWTEDELKDKLSRYAVFVHVESAVLQRLTSSVLGRQPENSTHWMLVA